ncbi:MAG TPA: hypothetical protein PKE65_04845 [Rhizobiaceae bacterium]|nr:hypothetical protein [Rhizobiaceae bacterium]
MRSSVELFSLDSGETTVVHRTDRLVEAPNWTPDGAALIINGDGRMFRIDLAAPDTLQEIDTGFATGCNNDHGLSPDGGMLAISDRTETGKSCIYMLPAGGGAPRRITKNVPSWWHGWSPDGQEIAYAAVRGDDRFGIWACPAAGGEERMVIGGDGPHYDGPDYTQDGEWIWFNSDRGGAMQLWRVRVDGTGAQQMTHDDRVNWFPHPSPDGRHVLYLAYPAGTTGHPRDLDVELRLIELPTGSNRTALSLFGGQGTINVPCWSPDGHRFAFVRYFPTT